MGLRSTGVLLLLLLTEQARPPAIHFDAISIKENRTEQENGGLEIPSGNGRLLVTNAPMYRILAFAYDRKRSDPIEGLPEWTRSRRWDIQARVADEDLPAFTHLPFAQQKLLLQNILQERCHLQAHLTKKETPAYALVVAAGGLKMHEATTTEKAAAPAVWDLHVKSGEIEGHAVPVDALLYALSGISLDRQVVDRSGLKGLYDFDLRWSPDDGNSEQPSLFTAIQEQLGLRLQPAKAEVEALIVDHIEPPSAN